MPLVCGCMELDQTVLNAFCLTYLIAGRWTFACLRWRFKSDPVSTLVMIKGAFLMSCFRNPLALRADPGSGKISKPIDPACRTVNGDKYVRLDSSAICGRYFNMHKARRIVLEGFALGRLCFFLGDALMTPEGKQSRPRLETIGVQSLGAKYGAATSLRSCCVVVLGDQDGWGTNRLVKGPIRFWGLGCPN